MKTPFVASLCSQPPSGTNFPLSFFCAPVPVSIGSGGTMISRVSRPSVAIMKQFAGSS